MDYEKKSFSSVAKGEGAAERYRDNFDATFAPKEPPECPDSPTRFHELRTTEGEEPGSDVKVCAWCAFERPLTEQEADDLAQVRKADDKAFAEKDPPVGEPLVWTGE